MMKFGKAIPFLIGICFLLSSHGVAQQTDHNIRGTVTDNSTGDSIPGVNIVVKGTTTGTTTDIDGEYQLAAPSSNDTLRFSFIGYQTIEEPVNGRSVINISMRAAALSGEELVVVGYGTQQRDDLTGSVSSVDVDESKLASSTTIGQVLDGAVAGVQVVKSGGSPGGGVSVRIRGSNSITANSEPLYVIDGIPAFQGTNSRDPSDNPLNTISPNNIKSIEVLKDASATAIYGARGASGVVLITTKQGTSGEDNIEFSSSVGINNIREKIPVLDGKQYAMLLNEARSNAGLSPSFNQAEIEQFGKGTDWQDKIFRTAVTQNYSLGFSGGDENTRYLIRGNTLNEEGIIKESKFTRSSLRLNLDQDMFDDRVQVGTNLTISRTKNNEVSTSSGIIVSNTGVVLGSLLFEPYIPVRDSEGNYNLLSPSFLPNPVATLELTNINKSNQILGNTYAQIDINDNLSFKSDFGGNFVFQQNPFFAPGNIPQGVNSNGNAEITTSERFEWTSNNIFTFQSDIGESQSVKAIAGFTYQTSETNFVSAGSENFNTNKLGYKNLGAGRIAHTPSSNIDNWSIASYLARINYSINNRYLITATGRYDGSSRFGENERWGLFPSFALGWRILEEPFMENQDLFSTLKVRLSYGKTGNQEIASFGSVSTLSTVDYIFGANRTVGFARSSRAPNPNLKWEETEQYNIGLDAGLFEDRISFTADAYLSKTSDLLLEVQLPANTGFSSQLQNVGKVENRGVELGITSRNIQQSNFTWNTSLNVGLNRNKVIDLGQDDQINILGKDIDEIIGSPPSVVKVGEPLGSFYGYKTDGIWQEGESGPGAVPGEYKIVDVNNDGQISPEDRTILGSAQPDFFGALNNRFAYKSFTLDVSMQGSFGYEVLNVGAIFYHSGSFVGNQHKDLLNRWTPNNPSDTYPRANVNRPRRIRDVYVEDGTYIRLQNLTIGYELPTQILPIGLSSVRLYAAGENLALWTNYTGYDPETNSFGGDPAARAIDTGAYPRARTLRFGINLSF